MFAEVHVSGPVVAREFWEGLCLVILLLVTGFGVAICGPGLLWWVMRPKGKTIVSGIFADTTTDDVQAVEKIARALAGERRKSRGRRKEDREGSFEPSDANEKRRHVRRQSQPKRIWISCGQDGGEPLLCWVTNRSRGGLGIVVQQPLTQGAIVAVRPTDAPADIPWIQMSVRSCRSKGTRWYLGCQFTEELPWSTVLMFG